jgi:hypothetical protein
MLVVRVTLKWGFIVHKVLRILVPISSYLPYPVSVQWGQKIMLNYV